MVFGVKGYVDTTCKIDALTLDVHLSVASKHFSSSSRYFSFASRHEHFIDAYHSQDLFK